MNKQTTIQFDTSSQKYTCNIEGSTFKTARSTHVEYMYKKITGKKASIEELMGTAPAPKVDKFSINKRFEFVENLVKMVGLKLLKMVILFLLNLSIKAKSTMLIDL